MDKNREAEILECTIRDGNYSINFQFTEEDTRLLTGVLSKLGFRWIEIGHGLGLGAMEAGKGDMPANDVDLIKAAKKSAGESKIGTFFIPGIGKKEDIKKAHDAGLDFIRVGNNASEAEGAFPFIEYAKELGMLTCLNMMKTYVITPKEFALKGKRASEIGTDIIYCVDSAGCMLRDDVAQYFSEFHSICDGASGFHGHNNLMMAIDNCIAAYENGASFFDTTLCGMGRSAGNAPTEILVAVLKRLNIKTRIDLFELMDVIEQHMWPLVSQSRAHDLVGVVSGYAKFHSSFLPKVAAVADKYDIELKRLIARVSSENQEVVKDEVLEQVAKELVGTKTEKTTNKLMSFYVPEISDINLSNSLSSVKALVDGLNVASSKRSGSKVVLQLNPSEKEVSDLVMPEFLLSDEKMVMGRVKYGSLDTLKEVVKLVNSRVSIFLVNGHEGWAKDSYKISSGIVGINRTVLLHDDKIRSLFLIETLDRLGQLYGEDSLLVYGSSPFIKETLKQKTIFNKVFIFGKHEKNNLLPDNVILINNLDDLNELNLKFNVILCDANPIDEDIHILNKTLANNGSIVTTLKFPNALLHTTFNERLKLIDMNLAYAGLITRQIAGDICLQ